MSRESDSPQGSSGGLPRVAADVAVEAVDLLPARLRRRLDDVVAGAGTWTVTALPDGVAVRLDDEVEVVLVVQAASAAGGSVADGAVADGSVADGAVVRGEDARCSCLLAPKCLHRAAVLSAAPPYVAPADAATGADAVSPQGASGVDAVSAAVPVEDADPDSVSDSAHRSAPAAALVSEGERAAADGLWRAGRALLAAGTSGASALVQTEVLRAAHAARLAGLHGPAAGALRVVTLVREARSGEPQYRLDALVDELTGLLDAVHALRGGGAPGTDGRHTRDLDALRGTARRAYGAAGSLRLYGVFTEPVVAGSGHAGVVTYVVDAAGHIRTIADVAPGGPERVASAADGPLRLGGVALSHRELGHGAGVIVSGATESADGRLGSGAGVRAVTASGGTWLDQPLAALWQEPYARQVSRAAATGSGGDRPAGADLLFLRATVIGPADDALVVDADGLSVSLTAPDDRPELRYRENLRILSARPGLPLLVVARLPSRGGALGRRLGDFGPGTPQSSPRKSSPRKSSARTAAAAHALAIAWLADGAVGGRVDLGVDRLRHADLAAAAPTAPLQEAGPLPGTPHHTPPTATSAPPLHLVARAVDRTVVGGRAVVAAGSRSARADVRRLAAARLPTAAAVLRRLADAADDHHRDAFGRLHATDGDAFARDWLAASLYLRAAARSLTEHAWRSPPP